MAHEEEQDTFTVQHQQAWDLDITEKHRLSKMADPKDHFAQQIISRRQEEFEALRVSLLAHDLSAIQLAFSPARCSTVQRSR